MASHHDWGLSYEEWFGGTPDDEPFYQDDGDPADGEGGPLLTEDEPMKTLEQYFRDALERSNWVDHAIRCDVKADGSVSFYIHPYGKDGDTLDFRVEGNILIPINNKLS